jgi:uncharacterized phage protein (TIGR01671 family)
MMSRTIKFRAWEYGHEFTNRPGWKNSPMVWKMNLEPELYDCEYFGEQSVVRINAAFQKGGAADYEKEHKSIFMQFTGLQDKNGKDIYEGDIVNVTTNHVADLAPKNPKTTSTVEIKFERAMFMFGDMTMNYFPLRDAELEVIGNIYENPELLTKPESGE